MDSGLYLNPKNAVRRIMALRLFSGVWGYYITYFLGPGTFFLHSLLSATRLRAGEVSRRLGLWIKILAYQVPQ